MAIQSDGITVVVVEGVMRDITFLVGNAELKVTYLASIDRFRTVHRGWIDGRRGELPRFEPHRWNSIMRQAHAIAHDRGWKRRRPA